MKFFLALLSLLLVGPSFAQKKKTMYVDYRNQKVKKEEADYVLYYHKNPDKSISFDKLRLNSQYNPEKSSPVVESGTFKTKKMEVKHGQFKIPNHFPPTDIAIRALRRAMHDLTLLTPFYQGRDLSKGLYVEGKPEFLWKVYDADESNLFLEVNLVKGIPEGPVRAYADKTLIVEGNMSKGQLNGSWRFSNQSTQELVRQGKFVAGKLDSTWTYSHDNGKKAEIINYELGVRQGDYESFSEGGVTLKVGKYEQGELVGLWKYYYPNGQLKKEVTYISKGDPLTNKYGYQDGPVKAYHPNGKVEYTGTFKDDKKHGQWMTYFETGHLMIERNYEKGVRVDTSKSYHMNGKIAETGRYEKGKKEGLWEEYYPTGMLKEKKFFQAGELINHTSYNEQGKLVSAPPDSPQPVAVESLDIPRSPAEFPGGQEEMYKWLNKNMDYPRMAVEAGIQGKVFVQFVVSTEGKINHVKVLRGIGGGCDEEAVRVIKKMPNWIPAREAGMKVPMRFTVPISFRLQ